MSSDFFKIRKSFEIFGVCFGIVSIFMRNIYPCKNGQDGKKHNMEFREIETYAAAIGKNKSKRKFTYTGLGCRGMFHKMIFSKLDKVCDECYDIFKIPEIHHLCRYLFLITRTDAFLHYLIFKKSIALLKMHIKILNPFLPIP